MENGLNKIFIKKFSAFLVICLYNFYKLLKNEKKLTEFLSKSILNWSNKLLIF